MPVATESGSFDSLRTWEICTAMPHTCKRTIYAATLKPKVRSVRRAMNSLKYDRFPLMQMTAPALATALIPVFVDNPKASCDTCRDHLKQYTSVIIPPAMMTKLKNLAKQHLAFAFKIRPMIQIVVPYAQLLHDMGHHASVVIEGSTAVKQVFLFTLPCLHT